MSNGGPTGPGPPYPRGSVTEPIGLFRIGITPIGQVPPFDFWTTVISQYANSAVLTAMIQSFNDAADETQNLNNFYDMVWNINTAVGEGLDVWGRIVGVTRSIQLPAGAGTFLGFGETGDPTHDVGFGQAPFYTGQSLTTNISLGDSDFRTLIFAKALSNICNGSIPGINAVLLALFPGRGNCFVTDGRNMTMTYTFQFALSGTELAILQFSGVLPRPAGVSATVVHP